MSSPRYSCCILRAACRMLHASFLPGNQRTCSCACACACAVAAVAGGASCYCCKLFMHFEVYLKHESKRSALLALLCSARSTLLSSGLARNFIPWHFKCCFFSHRASRIFSWLFVDFMYCFSCFTCPKWGRSRGHVRPVPCGHIWSP